MICPACDRSLEKVKIGGIVVDVCKNGCGGIWFDKNELEKVDEQHEAAGEKLLDFLCDENIKVDFSKKRKCPVCNGIIMVKHFESIKHEIEIDECYKCGGIWLDAGELRSIRKQFLTDEARRKAFDDYVGKVISPELNRMREESEIKVQQARNFAKAFRFICPSNYIPGKQEWAAF